ncbi:MAG: M13 family metallopeptidase N-terminal domain-containing protein, partial [Bryobacteraceae bacterium]
MFQRLALALVLAANLVFAQTPERPISSLPYTPSLDIPSMDRSINACENFYKYSCGGWIRNNPIPPDQARWDVYGKLHQDNQRYLWGLLEQAAKPGPDRNPVERQIGDFFHACMDEPAAEKAGASPLKQALKAVAALCARDLPSYLAKEHFASSTSSLFTFGSGQDFGDATRVIAFASAGGLGLPDRDYYVKTDPKSTGIREKYLLHVQRMLELAGGSADSSSAGARIVMEIETALAKASLTRAEKRDPYKLFHRLTRKQLQALTPSFRWDRYLAAAGMPGIAELNVTEPAFFQQLEVQLRARNIDDWKAYLRWHA